MALKLKVCTVDARTNAILGNVRIRISDGESPDSERTTDKKGTCTFNVTDLEQKLSITASKESYETVFYEPTLEEMQNGVKIALTTSNEASRIASLFKKTAAALGEIPVIGLAIRTASLFAAPLILISQLPVAARFSTYLLCAFVLWFILDSGFLIPSRVEALYHNSIDQYGIPSYHDSSTLLREMYPSGRVKYLGPGTVSIDQVVTIGDGVTVIVRAGTKFRFGIRGSLRVIGTFVAEGSVDSIIEFDSANPGERWGNVTALSGATMKFLRCRFSHGSGVGVKVSSDSKQITMLSDALPSDTRGGAVFAHDAHQILFKDCSFIDNSAAMGGAIYLRECDANIVDCNFENNRAIADGLKDDAGGGALCIYKCKPSLLRCVFTGNKAVEVKGCGGAVYIAQGSAPHFVACEFKDNAAIGTGGAIYGNNTANKEGAEPLKIINDTSNGKSCSFSRNIAGNNFEGGAIALIGQCWCYLESAQFIENKAGSGGGIYLSINPPPKISSDDSYSIRNCSFENNSSNETFCGADLQIVTDDFHAPVVQDNKFIQHNGTVTRVGITCSKPVDDFLQRLTEKNEGIASEEIFSGKASLDLIEYTPQPDTQSCQATAIYMVIHSNPSTRSNASSVSDIYKRMQDDANPEAHSSQAKILSDLTGETWVNRYVKNATHVWREIERSIRGGDPVVLSTGFTKSGHVVVVKGVRIKENGGKYLQCHDPFGEFSWPGTDTAGTPAWSKDAVGSDVFYSIDKLAVRVRYEWDSKHRALAYSRLSWSGERSEPTCLNDEAFVGKLLNENSSLERSGVVFLEDWEYRIKQKYCDPNDF